MLDAIARAIVRMLRDAAPAARVGHGRPRRERARRRLERRPAHVAGAGGRPRHRRPRRDRRARATAARRPRSSSCGSSRRRSSTSRDCRWPIATRASASRERTQFREVARRTWRFFDELVGPADHYLIPDNYQEDRQDVIAHRTSPTNIGLQLLSTLAARDLGYISYARRARSPRADVRHAPAHAALSRPLLQLVRHPDARAARAGLHLDGRQRQPRRLPADAALGPGVARRVRATHRRQRARRARRRDQPLRSRTSTGSSRAAPRAD